MTNVSNSNKALFINLLIFFLYQLIAYAMKIPVAFFCAIHIMAYYYVLRSDIQKVLAMKDLSAMISTFVLVYGCLALIGSAYFVTESAYLYFFLNILRLLINIYLLIYVFNKVISFFKKENGYLIVLEFAFVGMVCITFIVNRLFPLYKLETSSVFINNLSLAMNVTDYFFLMVSLSISLFLFKYQRKYIIGYAYPILMTLMSVSFVFSNIFLSLWTYRLYNVTASVFTLSLIFYRHLMKQFMSDPIPEIMSDADMDYRIGMIKNSNVVFLIFIISNGFLILFLLNLISSKVYFSLIFAILSYIFVSLLSNKVMMDKLLKKKATISKEKMKESIKERNLELANVNAKLEYLANHHRYTKLPNRFSFINEIGSIIEHEDEHFSLILIRLENVREFRSLYGVEKSFRLVSSFLERLKRFIKKDDFVYQLSNYEIAIISLYNKEEIDFHKKFESFYHSLHYLTNKEYIIDEAVFYLKLKLAFVRFPEDVTSLKDLFIISDLMSFSYKKDGDLQLDLKISEKLLADMQMKNKYSTMLKEAEFDTEFILYYQPQFDISRKKIVGAEALLRWKRGEQFISPGIFIPIAESIGLIYNISLWVSKTAIEQREKWKNLFHESFKIGINVSPLILDSYNFFDEFNKELRGRNVDYEDFDFEITEQSELANSPKSLYILDDIKSKGISISIDDFGTGYSSLTYVRMFKTDKIKIAKELVDQILDNVEYKYIVEGIINMAKTLNMKTIAEGVEDEKQLEMLKQLSCDELQGYIWGRPMAALEFEKLYEEFGE